jgi:hypothetical protein
VRKLALTLGALALTLALVTGAAGTKPGAQPPPFPPPPPAKPPPAFPPPPPAKKKKKPPFVTKGAKKTTRGARGPAGPRGARGPAGARGAAGLPGAKGDTGAPGAKGDKGDQGTQGIQGNQGIQGIQGTQGAKGDKGETGDTGPQGASANETAPAGTLLIGAVGGDFNVGDGDASSDWGVIVSLPMQARDALGDDDVFVNIESWDDAEGDETDDTSPGCTGTPAAPTAPAGKVCIYVAGGDNAQLINGWSILPGTGESRFGFKLGWEAPAAGDTFIDAVWAYRASS